MEIRNKRLSDEEFFREREEVLAEWPTGQEADLDEAVEYQRSLPPNKNWGMKLWEAKEKGTIYPTSGMGHTTVEQQTELLKHIQDNGPADLLAVSIDTFNRIHDYEASARGISESERTGTSVLNGYPAVNHGVAGMKRVIDALDVPVQSRFGAPDDRLIHEIIFAGGVNGMSGGLLNFFNYSSRVSLDVVMRNYQYIWRLEGYYQEKGVLFCDCAYAMYTVLVPPSLSHAAQILQLLLMAEQGIKCFMLHSSPEGNLVQDASASKVIQKLAREYLDKFGYRDAETPFLESGFRNRMPSDPVRAFSHICMSCLTARVSGAQVAHIRNISEARAIPIKEEIADSYRCANTLINLLRYQKIELDSKLMDEEAEMCERETRAIVDRVIDLGDGDAAIGMTRAVESGALDCPYSSNPSVASKVMGVRDAQGTVRWLDAGNLPFTREILDFHREKLAERSKKEGKKVGYNELVKELITIGTGHLDID